MRSRTAIAVVSGADQWGAGMVLGVWFGALGVLDIRHEAAVMTVSAGKQRGYLSVSV